MSTEKPLTPSVYWAQRKNLVYLRIAVEDCKDPAIKVDKQLVHFKGKGGTDSKDYEVNVNLFGEIKPEESKHSVRGRGIEFVLIKADDKAPYWKRLTSDDKKYHWIKIDFNRWRDEDDSDDEGPGVGGDFEEMMRQMGGLGGGGGGPGENLEDLEDEKDSEDEPLPDLED